MLRFAAAVFAADDTFPPNLPSATAAGFLIFCVIFILQDSRRLVRFKMKIEQARKAGLASGLARQSPQLIADKAKAIELHQIGKDTGAISQALPGRHRTEIRRWLIAAGIYTTKGRGKASAGIKRFNAVQLIADKYAKEFKQIAKTDDCEHWRKHPAINAYQSLKRYYANHEKTLERVKIRDSKRTLAQKIRHRLAHRIRKALLLYGRKTRKTMRTHEYIGCSIAELRSHLEKLFTTGMTWDNYGHNGWHIDHKRPCASFDLSQPEQQRTCFHFSNLQPLWEADNIRKSDYL